MGAGILPTTIYKNKLYFLFGKENKYEKSAPGFSDFGGGTDNDESFLETAAREACEELTGFLGTYNEIYNTLKKGTYNIDYEQNGHKTYRMHIFPYSFDKYLPYYYNNNQKFIQQKLKPDIIKNSRIFEKEHIEWMSIDDIIKRKNEFRHYFRNIIDMIYSQRNNIKKFITSSKKYTLKNHYINNKTKRKTTYRKKTSKTSKTSKR